MNMITDHLQSLSDRIQNIEQRPNLLGGQTEQPTVSTTRDQSETSLQTHRETTSNSVYDPIMIGNRQVSIARSNAHRIKLRGSKLTGTNYADWKRTVYLQLQQLKIEHLLAIPPNNDDQNELDTDREMITAIRLLLEDDVRAAIDRHVCNTAKDLWIAIEKENSAGDQVAKTTNLEFVTRHKLQSLKDLTSHCKKFAAAIHQLSSVGASFSKTSEVEMFLATLSHHHGPFVMHVQGHVRNQNLDLTETFIYCQREVTTYLEKAAQTVSNINKPGRFPNNSGWKNYSSRSRDNRLNPKNKQSNKFKPKNKLPFNHMKRRRDNYNNNNERNNHSNNYNNRSYHQSGYHSNYNSNYNNDRFNDGRSNRFYNNDRRPQSNVRAICNQPHNDGNESDESQLDNRDRVNSSVSAAIRNSFAQRPSGSTNRIAARTLRSN